MSADFVHLHTHTEYSLLDGACRLEDLVKTAVELGMSSLAITDHGVLYGVIEFYRMCEKYGIRPVIGCEAYVTRDHREKIDRREEKLAHLILLCRNQTGYHNLVQLQSKAFVDGFYYKPRVDMELLREHHEGLIALSACIAGEVPRLILAGRLPEARDKAAEYLEVFGAGNYFLEVQNHGLPEEQTVNQGLALIGAELSIPLVATNDVHYVRQDDAAVHDILLCIQTAKTVDDPERMRFSGNEYFLRSAEEMQAAFPGNPDVIAQSGLIAQRCEVKFEFGHFHLPAFSLPAGHTESSYLRELVQEKLPLKYSPDDTALIKRAEYELDIIDQMGFAGYFLIVQDLVNWSKTHGVPVGPGRGSAAGSVISYILGITSLDPIHYQLIFERFLNPERVSMPDIDIDFGDAKRDRVIDYIVQKYGADRVAQIITFGTMAAKAAIRDVGRALAMSYAEVDRIAKQIPAALDMTVDKALQQNPELQEGYERDPATRRLIDVARALEGMPRHSSMHAAGVVIAPERLNTLVPLQKTPDGHVITQFTKEIVEDIGLLKMDILGLRTLTILETALENIKKTRQITIDLETLTLDDPATYQLIAQGETVGVFQLESDGMRAIIREIAPSCIEDIIAINALYRPGPLGSGMVEDFINRKHGRQAIVYEHPWLEEILKETYGVILYQEQVMQIASRLGNFSLGQADTLRRAMGKKKPEYLNAMRQKFVDGAKENGISAKIADHLFGLMESFGGYGFNKSHSAAYAVVSFQTAYLKTHYPVEYMSAFLSSVMDNRDKTTFYLQECKKMGIHILPPDINQSYESFTVVDGAIRFGLNAIKSVGAGAVRSIVEARQDGIFASALDFCRRVDLNQVNRRVVENLVLAGCFDSLGLNRRQAAAHLVDCLELAAQVKSYADLNQASLFGAEEMEVLPPDPPDIAEYTDLEKMNYEKEILGFFVSRNPLDSYADLLPLVRTAEAEQLESLADDTYLQVNGLLEELTIRVSRRGEQYARLAVEDATGRMEALLFPTDFKKNRSNLQLLEGSNTPVVLEGNLKKEDERPQIIVHRIYPLPLVLKELHVKLPPPKADKAGQSELIGLLQTFPGDIKVVVHLPGNKTILLSENYNVAARPELKAQLSQIYGAGQVWFN